MSSPALGRRAALRLFLPPQRRRRTRPCCASSRSLWRVESMKCFIKDDTGRDCQIERIAAAHHRNAHRLIAERLPLQRQPLSLASHEEEERLLIRRLTIIDES